MSLYNRKGNYAEQMFENMTTKDGSTYEVMVLGLVKVQCVFFNQMRVKKVILAVILII